MFLQLARLSLWSLGDDWLLAIGEPVVRDDDGHRQAPMWRVTTSGKGVSHGWLRLTSEEGKIAALACRPLGDEAYEILAIERHFGVMRIVRFELFGAEPAAAQEAPPQQEAVLPAPVPSAATPAPAPAPPTAPVCGRARNSSGWSRSSLWSDYRRRAGCCTGFVHRPDR